MKNNNSRCSYGDDVGTAPASPICSRSFNRGGKPSSRWRVEAHHLICCVLYSCKRKPFFVTGSPRALTLEEKEMAVARSLRAGAGDVRSRSRRRQQRGTRGYGMELARATTDQVESTSSVGTLWMRVCTHLSLYAW